MDWPLFWTIVGSAVAIMGFIYTIFRNFKIDLYQKFDKIDQKFDKLENRMTKLEFDMIEVKTILRFKECCMIQDERQMKKAE